MPSNVKIIHNRELNLKVVLDRSKVVLDNPGADTPALVYLYDNRKEVGNASFNCAVEAAEVALYDNVPEHVSHYLNTAQTAWLEKIQDEVEEFLFPKPPQASQTATVCPDASQ
jgi:hypothetical protein